MTATVSIYGLFHKDRCIYVGRTADPISRMLQHKTRFWSILGEAPVLRILGRVSKSRASKVERKAIIEHRKLGQAEFNRYPFKKKNNVPVNLSIRADIIDAFKQHCAENKIVASELTENLWISFLRRKKVKLPPLFKPERNGKAAK